MRILPEVIPFDLLMKSEPVLMKKLAIVGTKNRCPRATVAAVLLLLAGLAVLPYSAQAQAPDARDFHTAVWTGNQMIVWAGEGGYGPLNSGGVYDPAIDTWTPTSNLNAPDARGYDTAVSTGSQMIVWGGADSNGIDLNTGGVYDPATDTWTPTSTLNAPYPRSLSTAVWAGSRMIVWGGMNSLFDPPQDLYDGGVYDPATDTWTLTSTLNAPDARDSHTAVWTGSQVIVWGGENVSADVGWAYLNTGGVYDPTTDTWTPTSTVNAPDARWAHTAIWTGSQMIVWGGVNNSYNLLNTGGVYDPTTHTWTPMSTVNAPDARGGHTAVWTGSQMIVWGGGNDTGLLNTGGVYDPATDTWTPTSTVNVPDARGGHTAVWTGSQMIVWGGGNDTGLLNTGGVYDPATDTWTPTSL